MSIEELFDNRPQVKRKLLNVLPSNPEKEMPSEEGAVGIGRFPSWLHRKLPLGGNLFSTTAILKKNGLNTVCEEAKCPNRFECYSNKTATFLALGKECTRSCGFCDIDFSKKPKAPEEDEPARIANSVKELDLKHVVITMVARDDLPDSEEQNILQKSYVRFGRNAHLQPLKCSPRILLKILLRSISFYTKHQKFLIIILRPCVP